MVFICILAIIVVISIICRRKSSRRVKEFKKNEEEKNKLLETKKLKIKSNSIVVMIADEISSLINSYIDTKPEHNIIFHMFSFETYLALGFNLQTNYWTNSFISERNIIKQFMFAEYNLPNLVSKEEYGVFCTAIREIVVNKLKSIGRDVYGNAIPSIIYSDGDSGDTDGTLQEIKYIAQERTSGWE